MSDRFGAVHDAVRSGPRALPSAGQLRSCATPTDGGRCTEGPPGSRTIRTGAISILFYEYFQGDNGAGLGASHQTGWTGLIARLSTCSGVSTPRTWSSRSGKLSDRLVREQVGGGKTKG